MAGLILSFASRGGILSNFFRRKDFVKGFDHPETTKTWDALYYGDPLSIRFYDAAIRRMLGHLRVGPGERLLDAGCGAGVHAIRAAKTGLAVDAIDFSPAALDDAAARAREAGLGDQVRFSLADLTQLKLGDGAYPKIFSWGVLIHIPEVEKAIDHLIRVLAEGGRLALYVSNSTGLQFRVARLKQRLFGSKSTYQRLPMGMGTRADLHGESIWVWFNDVDAMIRYVEARGLRLLVREPGEFCDLHLRFQGFLRRFFLRVNNFWFDRQLPASLAYMNLLVFEKPVRGAKSN